MQPLSPAALAKAFISGLLVARHHADARKRLRIPTICYCCDFGPALRDVSDQACDSCVLTLLSRSAPHRGISATVMVRALNLPGAFERRWAGSLDWVFWGRTGEGGTEKWPRCSRPRRRSGQMRLSNSPSLFSAIPSRGVSATVRLDRYRL